MGEKTEKASPKKLRDARKKGQVAKSQDLPSAFTFMVSVGGILAMTGFLFSQLSSFIISVFRQVTEPNLEQVITYLFGQGIVVIFVTSMPLLIVVSAVGVLINFLAVGPVFAPEVFKPDIKKFDPIANIKAKFKFKTLFELLKSIIKITLAGILIYFVMVKSFPVLAKTVSLPIEGSLLVFEAFLIEVLWKVGLLFVVVAVADFVYQKYNFGKEMMMEKFEVKQEYKNTEGDPHIKSKRKQIAQELAYQEGPAAGVKKSKAVVTNPIHIAIAVGYDRELDAAPYILAMGKDKMAEQIIKLAEENKVPVLRNIELAHELWNRGELYDYVPEDTYEPLAEILRWVASLQEETV